MIPARRAPRVSVIRYAAGAPEQTRDRVAAEEPLEVRIAYHTAGERRVRAVAVTMRTPGHDVDLSVGFLFSEGFVGSADDITEVTHCSGGEAQTYNIVEVRLAPGVRVDESRLERSFPVNSSCGVCGKSSLDALEGRGLVPVTGDSATVSAARIAELPDLLRAAQDLFERTGGIHAAGLFNCDGKAQVIAEDIGRHNAVDKVIGRSLLARELPLHDRVLVVSGRTSFEILQKVVAAGVPIVVAVGAPSSLAVDLARRFNVTLVGFARADAFNVYAGESRIQ